MAGGRIKFTLDTELNKSGINQLKQELQSLKNLTSQQMLDLGLSKTTEQAKKDLSEIKASATQVEAALNKSFSASLGTTNLTKFNNELKSMNLNKIQQDFNKAGAAGQMAFRDMTTAILTTKTQLKETNAWLTKMGETMTNTIRWGIASSAMNTFTGSVQKAWSYTKNLNTSLNNIRIVSNASAESMESFAVQANKAAKALGSSTKAYADASLIYYQQGLSSIEAQERANTTIKMANVTGESAQQVSDYMTAVWNNFYDGSKSLEYYADVMTALGAATASSTDEIASGLEKFAAIADTVGLSYEYATSALATITAETRQSADVVGTALKTLFARIQDLELGKTLDDGTTLGKYSEALLSVGINIKDANGQIKDMDKILDEMGQKWDTISKDQQIALAQNVAGVRQYAQLVALMDNWDTFKDNLQTATNATGALNKQQEIYMESIEAHLDKVGASAERVYKALTDTEGINSLLDTISFAITGVANYIEAIGGSTGVLLKLGAIGSKVFGKQIAQGLSVTIMNIKKADETAKQLNAEMEIFNQFKDLNSTDKQFKTLVEMKQHIIDLNKTLTDSQRDEANTYIERQNALENEIVLWEEKVAAAKEFYKTMTNTDLQDGTDAGKALKQKETLQDEIDNYKKSYKALNKGINFDGEGAVLIDELFTSNAFSKDFNQIKKLLDKATQENLDSAEELDKAYREFYAVYQHSIKSNDESGNILLDEIGRDALDNLLKYYKNTINEVEKETKDTLDTIDGMVKKTGDNLKDQSEENLAAFYEDIEKWTWQDTIEETSILASSLFNVASAINSITTIPDIWGNDNLTGGEKILQTIMAIASAINGFSQLTSIGESFDKIVDGLYKTLIIGQGALTVSEKVGAKAEDELQDEIDQTQNELREKEAQVIQEARTYRKRALEEQQAEKETQQEIKTTIKLVRGKQAVSGEDVETGQSRMLSNQILDSLDVFQKDDKVAEELAREKVLDYFRNEFGFQGQVTEDLPVFNDFKSLKQEYGLTNKEAKTSHKLYNRLYGNEIHKKRTRLSDQEKELMPGIIEKLNKTVKEKEQQRLPEKISIPDAPKKVIDSEELTEGGEKVLGTFDKLKTVISGVGKSIKGFVVANPYVVAAIAGVAAAIVGVTVALTVMNKIVNKNREAYEKSNKELAETQEILNQNRQSFKDFEESVISYTDAIVKVRELTVGTEEYANALADANEQAEALIQKYELFGRYSYGDHGEILIDADALYEVQREQRDALRQSELRYADKKAKNKYLEFKAKAEEEAYGDGFGMFTQYVVLENPTSRNQSSNSNLDDYNFTGVWEKDLGQEIADEILDIAQDEFGLTHRKNTSPVQKVEFGKADDLYADIVKAYANIENPGIYSDEELFEMLGKEVGMSTSAIEQFGRQLIDLTGSSEDFRKALDEMSDVYKQAEILREEVNKLHYQDMAEDILAGLSFGKYTEIANKAFAEYLDKNTSFDSKATEKNSINAYTTSENQALAIATGAGSFTGSNPLGQIIWSYQKNNRLDSYLKNQGIEDYSLGSKTDDDIVKLYAQKVEGWDGDLDKTEIKKTSGWFETKKYELRDADGKIIVGEKSIDEMRKEIVGTLAIEQEKQKLTSAENTTRLENNFLEMSRNINSFDNQYGTNILSAFYTAMANGDKTVSLGKEAFVGINDIEKDELLALSDDELMEKLLPDEEARNAASEQFGKSLATGIRDGLKKHSYSVKEAVNAVLEEVTDLSDEEKEIVGDMAKVLVEAADDTSIDKKNKYHDYLADNEVGSVNYAKKILEMNDAMELADENLEDWTKAIKSGPADLEAYSTAISGVTDVLKGLLGLDYDEFMDTEFIVENLNDITAAIKGNEAAMKKVKKAAQDAFMEDIDKQYYQEGTQEKAQQRIDTVEKGKQNAQQKLEDKKQQSQDGGKFDTFEANLYNVGQAAVNAFSTELINDFSESLKTPSQRLKELQDEMDNLGVDGMIDGMQQGEAALLESMNRIVKDAGMTVDQTNAMFALMGYTPVYSQETVDATRYVDVVTRYSNSTDGTYNVGGSTYTNKVEEAVYTERKAIPATDVLSSVQTQTPTGDSPAPKITKLIKNPTGSSGGKKYSPKGGGGGSSKKKKDPQKDEFDRYQKVNSKLDKIGNTLDKLQDKRDKLTGQDLFDNLLKQFDTLNDKIDVTKDKLAIAIDEMNEYKQELAKDYGIKFREDGIIDNYKEQYYKELNTLNAAINKYGASDKDSDQEKLEKAQERYDKFNELIKDYDELIGSFIPDLEKDIRESINQQIEIKLDAFHYEIELRLKMKDAELEWNEFKKVVLDDIDELDIFGNTKARLQDFHAYFKEMDDGLVQVATKHVNDILTELQKMDATGEGDIYKDSRQNLMDQLNEYYSTLIDNLTEVHELSEEIHDSYMEMMDEAQSKFNEQIDAYATINDLIEHDKNVITMIYGEESYSALSQFYDRQEENNNKQLDFQKQQVEFWANQMTLTEEGSEEWDKAKENWISAVSEWNSAVEAAIQNLQDKYLNAINEIFQKLNNEVTNGLGLDYVETQWDLVNRNAEEYLDSVNAIYNVQQLQSKYLDAIEQHDSASQQKKLNDLMEQEIGYLREQDKLSQYDIDRANLKYEIALKQIALEEAQQNKTQLRLRRDSQGNYTYQYTQDDDQVSSIQQEIADLYNQLYNLDAEEYRGNLEGLYDVWVEFQEKMAEAAQINDPEQRAAKELLIKEQYGELINTLAEKNELIQSNLNQSTMSHLFDLYNQNIENYDMMTAEQQAILSQFMTEETDFTNAAFDNLFGLYNTTVENFQGMSNAQRDILMESIVPQWETAVQAMADKIIGEGGFFPVCSEAFIKLDEATQEYETGLTTLQEAAGQSAEAIKSGLDPIIEKTQQLVKDNDMLIDTYNKELEAIRGVINELEILKAKYGEAFDAANKAAEAAKNMWMAASNKDANADPSKVLNSEFGTETDITPDLNEKGGYDQPTVEPVSEPAKPTLEIGSFVDVKSGALWYSNSYGGGRSGRAKDGKIKYINSKGSHPYNIGGAGWIKKSDIVGYDTGGYTGDWGSDGKLAMLHQKELVLNASDTKNMLNAIEIVREITSNLGTMLMSRMANIGAIATQGANPGELEQNVHITAEFPNVTSSREIEEALNNLTNKASQYIQTK